MKHCLLITSLLLFANLYSKGRPTARDSAQKFLDSFNRLYKVGAYDASLVLVSKAYELAQASNDSLLMAKSLNNTGLIYSSKGDPAKGIYYYNQSLAILRLINIQPNLSTALLNVGIALKEQAIYDKALAYLYEAVSYFEKVKDLKQLAAAYNTIGNIFRIQENYDKSLDYHFKALSLRRQLSHEEGINGSLNNIGAVYKMMGQYDSALAYLKSALVLKQEGAQPDKLANTLSQIGDIYIATKDYAQAKTFYTEAYQIRKQINNKTGIAMSLKEIGNLYYLLHDTRTAEHYLLECVALSQTINSGDNRLECYATLKDLYRSTSSYSKSLFYAERYIALNDSLLGLAKQKALTQMQVKYEVEQQQKENLELAREGLRWKEITKEQDLKLDAEYNLKITLIISIILLAAFIVILFFFLRNRRNYAKKLDTVMRELHHRVMNNFQVLSSLFQLQLNHIPQGNAYDALQSNSDRISAMMFIHKDLYHENNITKVKMKDYIVSLVQNLLTVYKGIKPVHVRYEISSTLELDVEKAILLGLIVNELVTNALKYAFGEQNENPALDIMLSQDRDGYILQVRDNGPGMLQQSSERSLGLKLADSMVKQLKGSMQREQDHGLCYNVRFKPGT